MPTVSLPRDDLFAQIGKEFTQDEFDELCFEFGLELDDVVVEDGVTRYKVEVPANRYDLLCVEGVSQALRVFLNMQEPPTYTLSSAPSASMKVAPEVAAVRPYVVCAILRDLTLDEASYQSLIDLQEKLHHNICRRRTLVAIGTHDLDSIEGPFSYEALPPEDMQFVPLRQSHGWDGRALLEYYKKEDAHLRQYVHILEGRERFPYVLDSQRRVLSMPPIINGERSKISPSTRNMLIECTATDRTKAHIVLNVIVAAFSRYCARPFHVDTVAVQYPNEDSPRITPDFSTPELRAGATYVNNAVGVDITPDEMARLLGRMQVPARTDGDEIVVSVPIIRPDLLHACDIMCDVAVAYGFNRIEERIPRTPTVGKQQPLNHLADLVRREGLAEAGYTEVLTWVTVSHAENYDLLRRTPDDRAVVLGNPKTAEFQECRTSLLPGLLKTLRENRRSKVPIRLFEVGDVVLQDVETEVGAKNRRKIAAVYCATHAGFEVIQGLLEHVMTTLGVNKEKWNIDADSCDDGAFFEGRRADVKYNEKNIGTIGWVHPEVLTNFNLSYPCSAMEIDLEMFL